MMMSSVMPLKSILRAICCDGMKGGAIFKNRIQSLLGTSMCVSIEISKNNFGF